MLVCVRGSVAETRVFECTYYAFQVPCRPVFRELHFNNESDWHDILEQPFVTPPVIYKNIMIYLTPINRVLALDKTHGIAIQLFPH